MKRSIALLFSIGFLLLSALPVAAQRISLASQSNSGTGANGRSYTQSNQALSRDGRFVVFVSFASNLVTGDNNDAPDIFMRDTQTGVTSLVSVSFWEAGSGNGWSHIPAISPDGRFVAFYSTASDLVRKDTNRRADVFVRDMLTGQTRLINPHTSLTVGFTPSGYPSFSGDSSTLLFCGQFGLIYAYNLQTSTVMRVGVNLTGDETADCYDPAISANGRYVVFKSNRQLAIGDLNNKFDIYVRDLVAGVTRLVSYSHAGVAAGNNESLLNPTGSSISDDGRFVGFVSYATDLVPNNNSSPNFYIRDLEAGVTKLVSLDETGMAGTGLLGIISADGQTAAFITPARLTADDNNNDFDIYVHNLLLGRTMLITGGFPRLPNQINNNVFLNDVSRDGRYVSFRARIPDAPDIYDIYLHDVLNGQTMLVTRSYNSTGGGNAPTFSAVISPDGRTMAISSDASNLMLNDAYFGTDVFVCRLAQFLDN